MASIKVEKDTDLQESVNFAMNMDFIPGNIVIKTEPIDPESSNSDSEAPRSIMKHPFQDVLRDLPEINDYISQLQASIIRQQLKLDKLHKKVKKLKKHYKKRTKAKHVSTQTGDRDVGLPQECAITSTLTTTETSVVASATDSAVAWQLGDSDQTTGENVLSLAEQVKIAAQSAMQCTSFVYEPKSGMYYDYSTGYYYNAEMGLYYDGNTGTYFSYDEKTKAYSFHSQVSTFKNVSTKIQPTIESENVPKTRKKKLKKVIPKVEKEEVEEVPVEKISGEESPEEGECSDSSKHSQVSQQEQSESESDDNAELEPKRVWPPCMRIIVQETNIPHLKVGNLFIVTCTGGTMGREGDHSVIIRDTNVSKHHAKFSFDESEGKYYIIDFGSRNGTILDGKRLSVAKQESNPCEVVHGSVIVVGGTKLLCHIHSGIETCGHCEPGLVQKPKVVESKYVFTSGGIGKEHRKELKRIRKKFGLTNIKANVNMSPGPGYEDRASIRRLAVGSSHHKEKTKTSSVHEAISEENKGFKMLSKMGWSKGEALGKEGGGLMEPVLIEKRVDKVGLGSVANTRALRVHVNTRRGDVWKKTQQRYQDVCKVSQTEVDEEKDEENPKEVKQGENIVKRNIGMVDDGGEKRKVNMKESLTESEFQEVENVDDKMRNEPVTFKPVMKRTVVKTVKRKEISPTGSVASPPSTSMDERRNAVWKKTQQRLKEARKGGTPVTPPRQEVEEGENPL